jgi:signal transduction histidine kinase
VLPKLLDTLMRTAIEHAGATRGLLIVPWQDELRVEAEASAADETIIVRLHDGAAARAEMPQSIVRYVLRTGTSAIIDDTALANAFSADRYVERRRARAIACLPLLNQSRVTGAIYLENELAPQTFTATRLAVLKLISSQAAISIENTRLYVNIEEREERLRQAQADLAHVTRVTTLGELAASLAHEIKQPLTGASMNAGTCVRAITSAVPNLEIGRLAASRIGKDLKRATDIVARIESLFKKQPLPHASVALNDTIQEMLAILRSEATRHMVALRAELAPALPPVLGDRVQIQQVILNLIVNAIEATKESDGPREIKIGSRLDDAHVLVSVSDTGRGLPEQGARKIFDAFFTTKQAGTGMGLSISRSIIEAHGGRISAENNPERGATFVFTVPVLRGD